MDISEKNKKIIEMKLIIIIQYTSKCIYIFLYEILSIIKWLVDANVEKFRYIKG